MKNFIGRRNIVQIGRPNSILDDQDTIIGQDNIVSISDKDINQYNKIIGEENIVTFGSNVNDLIGSQNNDNKKRTRKAGLGFNVGLFNGHIEEEREL